jgi:hypothetical protein
MSAIYYPLKEPDPDPRKVKMKATTHEESIAVRCVGRSETITIASGTELLDSSLN